MYNQITNIEFTKNGKIKFRIPSKKIIVEDLEDETSNGYYKSDIVDYLSCPQHFRIIYPHRDEFAKISFKYITVKKKTINKWLSNVAEYSFARLGL